MLRASAMGAPGLVPLAPSVRLRYLFRQRRFPTMPHVSLLRDAALARFWQRHAAEERLGVRCGSWTPFPAEKIPLPPLTPLTLDRGSP